MNVTFRMAQRSAITIACVALGLIVLPQRAHSAQPIITAADLTAGSNYGRTVARDVDFNSDGYADLVVGDPSRNQVLVYFGGTAPDALADLVLTSGGQGSGFGIAVARVPDISGDGINEIAVGASGSDKVFVFYGGTSPNGVADLTVTGPATFPAETFGFSVA